MLAGKDKPLFECDRWESNLNDPTVIDQMRPRLHRVAYSILHNTEDAEDAVQEALLRAHDNAATFRHESSPASYMTRAAINASLMIIRKKKGRDSQSDSIDETADNGEGVFISRDIPQEPTQFKECDSAEQRQMLQTAIMKLPPGLRMAVVLKDLDELSTQEVAETMGISVPAVKSRVLRARMGLRGIILRQLMKGNGKAPDDTKPMFQTAARSAAKAAKKTNVKAAKSAPARHTTESPVLEEQKGALAVVPDTVLNVQDMAAMPVTKEAMLSALSPTLRQTVLLREDGLSNSEVAAVEHTTPGIVIARLRRARMTLVYEGLGEYADAFKGLKEMTGSAKTPVRPETTAQSASTAALPSSSAQQTLT